MDERNLVCTVIDVTANVFGNKHYLRLSASDYAWRYINEGGRFYGGN